MITNPFQIEKDTFFICGHELTTDNVPNKHFSEVEKFLTEQGLKVFNPFSRVDCKDVKQRIAYLVMCEKVITLPDFDRYENTVKEVRVARDLGREIIAASGLEHWLKRTTKAEKEA